MRAEVPSAAEEVIAEIRRVIPEYARSMDGPYGQALQAGVMQSLTAFIDLVADPSAPIDGRDEICRRLGQYEAQEGRTLDGLQAAYRIGCQVAWRRVMKLGLQMNLPASVMASLADAVFSYANELATLSADGYHEAQRRSGAAVQHARRRLLRLILEQPAVPRQGIASVAEQANWPLPQTVTPVVLRLAPDSGHAGGLIPLLDDDLLADMLADLDAAQPLLLVPGPVTAARQAELAGTLSSHQAVIGLTVPLALAADSVRWAHQALSLAESGIIEHAPMIRCEDHMVALWLLSDVKLADQVVQHQLGTLAHLTPHQRAWVTDTLGPWLEKRGGATEIAELLHVHPQTVRYRIRQFEQAFGDRLSDPEARFALELALRVMRLRQRTSRQAARKQRDRPAESPAG
jgi:hypothetical protein